MEEPELRVGGWEKEKGRRSFRRLFNLILILIIAFAFISPSVINYNPAYVPSESLYLANGMWNGPFDIQYSKQFSGHIKVSSVTYETTLDSSGALRIISMSSFMNLEDLKLQTRVLQVVEEEASKEGFTLTNGVELNEDLDLPTGYSIYQWEGKNYSPTIDEEITIRAIFWNEKDEYILDNLGNYYRQYQTVICIIFADNGTSISQATELIEDVI